MIYKSIREDLSFQKWREYTPLDTQYIRYADRNPSVVAAGHKIEDVYYCFANARCSFMNAGASNFGDISADTELSKKYTKSHFLVNAVLEYAICLDLSWQVIWAYIQPASFEYLVKQDYTRMEKECTRENVHIQLNCAISQNGIGSQQASRLKDILIQFDDDTDVIKLRSIYNMLKHHGTIHFSDLHVQMDSLLIEIDGRSVPTLSRKAYSFCEVERALYNYHTKFEKYFDSIIDEIMPDDYQKTTIGLYEYLRTALKMDALLNDNS